MRFVKIIRLFKELHLHLRRSTHILPPLLLDRLHLNFTVFVVVTTIFAVIVVAMVVLFSMVKLFKALIIIVVYVERSVNLSWLLQ